MKKNRQNLLQKNEELLCKMQDLLEQKRPGCHFVRDGLLYRGDICCPGGFWQRNPSNMEMEDVLWETSPLKIMFLMKDYTNESMDDIRYETGRKNHSRDMKDILKRDNFTMNIIYWLYGLTHRNVPFSEIKDGMKCFHFYERYPLVRINCKKISGKNTISNTELKKYISDTDNIPLLKEQITMFAADIIVCCGGGSIIANYLMKQCFQQYKWNRFEDESLWYCEEIDTLIIDTYHPSHRSSRELLFNGITSCFERFVTSNNKFQDKIEKMKSFEKYDMENLRFSVIMDVG